jgi:hypothetical protein
VLSHAVNCMQGVPFTESRRRRTPASETLRGLDVAAGKSAAPFALNGYHHSAHVGRGHQASAPGGASGPRPLPGKDGVLAATAVPGAAVGRHASTLTGVSEKADPAAERKTNPDEVLAATKRGVVLPRLKK